MWEVPDHFRVRIGGNIYIDVQNIVEYQGQSIFTLKRHDDNGYLGIYFEIYDADGNRTAYVKRNEIYPVTVNAEGRYTVEGSRTNCSFTDTRTGETICDIKRYEAASPQELDVSVKLYMPDGFLFNASPTQTNLRGMTMIGNILQNVRVGISVQPGGSIGLGAT